jgi:hypothetical protein
MITTCSRCGALYEAGSEEQANEPDRLCRRCFAAAKRRPNVLENERLGYPHDWPSCPGCGMPALDGHITCGDVACDEAGRR